MKTTFTILLALIFNALTAQTLQFDEPFGTQAWTEDGHAWSWDNTGWDNIRDYLPHSGTGHGMSAAGYHSKLATDVNINIQGIWIMTQFVSDFAYFNLKGYNESGTEIYSVSLNPADYEMNYAYVTLNWVGVKSIMVDYNSTDPMQGHAAVFYDDMDYSFVSPTNVLNFDQPFGTQAWTEDGHAWSWDDTGWDNIRDYLPHSGTGHGMSAAGYHSKLATDVNINIQGIWIMTQFVSDFAYFNLKGYNESGTEIYSVSLNPADYEMNYAYVTLNWVGVKKFMVDYNSTDPMQGHAAVFYDDMDYSFVSPPNVLNFDQPFGTQAWTEDGHSWSWDDAGWDNIRDYLPHSGTGHAMSAAGYHSKLATDVNINIQGIWIMTQFVSDFAYFNLKGYNESGTEIYSVSLNPADYEMNYAYVTLNWVGVKKFMVDYNSTDPMQGHAAVFYDDMDYSYTSVRTGTDTRTECSPFTWIDGNTYTSDNSTARYTIVGGAASGVDTLVTLNLTVKKVSDITTTKNGEIITANNASATYKWLDCNSNFAVIPDATGQSFTSIAGGNYAVKLVENGCADTSDCVSLISTVGLATNTTSEYISVFPNPSAGIFTCTTTMATSDLQVFNLLGKKIYSVKPAAGVQQIDLTGQPKGVYYYKLLNGNKLMSAGKIIIERNE